MNPQSEQLKRRKFLTKALQTAVAGLATSGNGSAFAAESKVAEIPMKLPIQIGILLGTFRTGSVETRLDAAKTAGITHVQLSMDCAGLPAMPEEISPALAARIRRAAKDRGITIASVSGTFNMCHPDTEQRRTGVRRLRVLAESCSALGISKIHICTGTRSRDGMWRNHPDNNTAEAWRDSVACIREATKIAQQHRVTLAFEPEVNNVVNSAQKARRLLDEIASPFLKVTFDAANLYPAGQLPRMKEILDEAFALLGKDIVLAHAKDVDHDGDAGHLAAGQGKLDYDRYVALLHQYKFSGPLLLHSLSEAQVPGCVAFLREKIARLASHRSKDSNDKY